MPAIKTCSHHLLGKKFLDRHFLDRQFLCQNRYKGAAKTLNSCDLSHPYEKNLVVILKEIPVVFPWKIEPLWHYLWNVSMGCTPWGISHVVHTMGLIHVVHAPWDPTHPVVCNPMGCIRHSDTMAFTCGCICHGGNTMTCPMVRTSWDPWKHCGSYLLWKKHGTIYYAIFIPCTIPM